MYKIGPNKFMGGGGVCGRGEKGGAFCSVCIFHNQKMHVYLIKFLSNFCTNFSIFMLRGKLSMLKMAKDLIVI